MPAKVSDRRAPSVTAGLANDVDAVNQYAPAMYAATANGAAAARPERTTPNTTSTARRSRRPRRGNVPAPAALVRRERDGGDAEHEVGEHRAAAGAGDLRGDVRRQVAPRPPPERRVGGVTAGLRCAPETGAERQQDRDERAGRRERVDEQPYAVVVGEALGRDARADDRGDEEKRAGELGEGRSEAGHGG